MGNDLKKEATCSTCLKILNKPVLLPCECSSICHEHIDELIRVNIENSLTCEQCAKTFDLKNATFAENQILNNKIKSMEYLSIRERNVYRSSQNKLEQMEKLQNDHEEKLNEFTTAVVDHFNSLKNEIDIRRETVLEEMHNKNNNEDEETLLKESSELIERTEQGEETFLRNSNQKIKSYRDEVNLEHERNQISEFFRKTQLSKLDLENLENDVNFKLMSLKDNLKRFDSFQLLLEQNYFKPHANNNRLGELFVNANEIRIVIFVRKSSKVIEIYNLFTGKLIHQLTGHTKRVTCASLYDRNKLVSGRQDGSIKFWDLQTGKCSKTLYVDRIYCLKVLKNGDLATGSGRNSIIIWDMVMFEMKFTLFSNDPNKITCLDQLSNEWLVSGGFDNDAIEIWDLNKQVCIRGIYSSQSKHTFSKSYSSNYRAGRVTFLKAFEKTIDGKIECFFATGTGVRQQREVICIWNASNGTCVKEFFSNRDPESHSISLCSLESISHDQLLCSYDLYFYYHQFYQGHAQLLINLTTFKETPLGMKACYSRFAGKYGHEISEQLRKIKTISEYWEAFIELYSLKIF